MPDPTIATTANATQEMPRLELTLTPRVSANGAGIHVSYIVSEPSIDSGAAVCRLPATIVGIPGAPITTDDLRVSDELGRLLVVEVPEKPTPTFAYRRWNATRNSIGDIHVEYFAPARTGPATLGPLFDVREENGGLIGAGITFLALPNTTCEYDFALNWDLSELPPNHRATSNLGDGNLELSATAETIAFSFYVVGPLTRHPSTSETTLAVYWLSQPPFDPVAVADRTERIYDVMAAFFDEPNPGYRVFIRRHAARGIGGTALPRAFMLGYSQCEEREADDLAALLAHEVAHNWPRLDSDHVEAAWYTEGTAEYYSIVLSHRHGLISDDEYLTLVNERTRAYYTNPLRGLSNSEAAQLFWKDPRAQRIPYERGLFYFLDLNAKIRRHSRGDRSVDELVLEVLHRQRNGEKVTVGDWVGLVTAELGEQGRADFAALIAGRPITLEPDALGSSFTYHEIDDAFFELGFGIESLRAGVVTGLDRDSNAARSGLQEGDRILDVPSLSDIASRDEVVVAVSRANGQKDIRYVPRGSKTTTLRWTRTDARATSESRRLKMLTKGA